MDVIGVVVVQRHAFLAGEIARVVVAVSLGLSVQSPTRQAVQGVITEDVGFTGGGVRDLREVANRVIDV